MNRLPLLVALISLLACSARSESSLHVQDLRQCEAPGGYEVDKVLAWLPEGIVVSRSMTHLQSHCLIGLVVLAPPDSEYPPRLPPLLLWRLEAYQSSHDNPPEPVEGVMLVRARSELLVVHVAREIVERVLLPRQVEGFNWTWLPSKHAALFVRRDAASGSEGVWDRTYRVLVRDLNHGSETQLYEHRGYIVRSATLSPDERWLSLKLRGPRGVLLRIVRLSDGAVHDIDDGFVGRWSPVDDRVAIGRSFVSEGELVDEILLFDPVTKSREVLVRASCPTRDLPPPNQGAMPGGLAWSPDGREIAYSRFDACTFLGESAASVWAVDLDDRASRRLSFRK